MRLYAISRDLSAQVTNPYSEAKWSLGVFNSVYGLKYHCTWVTESRRREGVRYSSKVGLARRYGTFNGRHTQGRANGFLAAASRPLSGTVVCSCRVG